MGVMRLSSVLAFAAFALMSQAAPASILKPAERPQTLQGRQLAVTTSQSRAGAAAGGTVSLFVDVFPKPKMHVYAPEQTGGYIRIELTLDDDPAVKEAKPVFPKGADYYFEPLKETFKVFDAPFRIRQDVTLTASSSRAPVTLTGTLRYQACDDQVCYRPDTIKVSWTVDRLPAARR
jgi:DsbC/DsbD-like thiol-disulfide interchange protein